MSYRSKGNDRREGSHHANLGSSLQKKREREKIRRQQEFEKPETREPYFQPMRRMERQDSLARNINNVLGDVDLVRENLRRQPNDWYGTSRSCQAVPSPLPPKAEMNNITNNSKFLSGSQRGPSHSTSSGVLNERPPQADLSTSSTGFRPSEYDSNVPSKSKQQGDRHGQSYVKVASDNAKRQRMSPFGKSSTASQNLSVPTEFHSSRESSHAGIRRSDRDRVSSVDSDMLRVENILEEMVDIPPSITDIKTPSVNELKNFNFIPSAQRKRADNPVESSHIDASGLSDEESSEDTSEDDNDWNLGSFSKGSKPQNSSLHSQSVNLSSSKTASDVDTHNRSYPDNRSLPRKKGHTSSGSENQRCDAQRSFKDDNQSSSGPSKSRSRSSSSSQLHNSPRQRQQGAKDIHSSAKQSKDTGSRRNSGSSLNPSRNEARSNKARPQKSSHVQNMDMSEPGPKSSKSHKTVEAGMSRLGKESSVSIEKFKSKSTSVPKGRLKSNSDSSCSSSSDSSSEESANAHSSEDDEPGPVFTDYPAQSDSHAIQHPFAKTKSSVLNSPKKVREPQLEDNKATGAYEQNNASWSNSRTQRTNFSGSGLENNCTDQPYEEEHSLNHATVKPDTAHANQPMANDKPPRLSLWVKLKSSLLPSDFIELFGIEQGEPPPNIGKLEGMTQSPKRPMVTTGSETEQPIRRADSVQVAVADGSSDWKGSSVNKRKCAYPDQGYDSVGHKRHRRDTSRSKQQSRSFPGENWRGTVEEKQSVFNTSGRLEHSVDSNERFRPTSSRMEHQSPNSSNRAQRTTVNVAPVVLPDSSVPGEQDRMETSDWYMREGKKMKHEGDGMVDSRTGRTRLGESLSRARAYFEASLLFIMSGYVMESENREDRLETGSNSSSSTAHSPTNMYQQTLPLLDFVLKLRPRHEQDDRIFKRMTISCLKCQSYLYFRIFKLKMDIAVKNSEVLTEQFKTLSKSAQTHSPWRNANAAPNVLSPLSPAVPSPFTHHGPSPASSNGDQVSSSTQAGKMTPSTHANYSLPQKMYDTYRQHHAMMCNVLKALEKWEQAELMMEGHVDFFRHIDVLCNRTLTFHSSLRDVYFYYKVVLGQLHALMTSSPSA